MTLRSPVLPVCTDSLRYVYSWMEYVTSVVRYSCSVLLSTLFSRSRKQTRARTRHPTRSPFAFHHTSHVCTNCMYRYAAPLHRPQPGLHSPAHAPPVTLLQFVRYCRITDPARRPHQVHRPPSAPRAYSRAASAPRSSAWQACSGGRAGRWPRPRARPDPPRRTCP